MRMTASWSGRYGPTEYKVVARYFAPDGKLPSDRFVVPLKKNNRSTIEISVDRKCPIQGLLRLHSRYGSSDRSVTKATFVTRLQPCRSPGQAARQLPDQSTTLWVESSSTDDSRLRGARPSRDIQRALPLVPDGQRRDRCQRIAHQPSTDAVREKPSSIQPVTPPIIILTGRPNRARRTAALLAPLQCGPAQ